MRSGGEGTASEEDMVGGSQDEHTLATHKHTHTCILRDCSSRSVHSHIGGVHLFVGKGSTCTAIRVASMTVRPVRELTTKLIVNKLKFVVRIRCNDGPGRGVDGALSTGQPAI